MEQVRINPEELDQAFEGCTELTEPGRNRRLDVFIVELTALNAEEPTQIKTTQVATHELGPDRDE
jgi:hypothetical protein